MKSIALMMMGMCLSCNVMAQSVKVDFDKKVITTDSLNMPANTNAYTLLALLPELLQRPGDFYYSNYEVNVDGMSVSNVRDAALQQLQIDDIEKIEVDESPISSYKNNGVGGTINIVLRSHGAKSDALWGSASNILSYPFNESPLLFVGHRSKAFMVKGLLLADIANSSSEEYTDSYNSNGMLLNRKTVTDSERYRGQMARAYMQFDLSPKDILKVNLSQSYSYNSKLTTKDFDVSSATMDKTKYTQLYALMNYEHSYRRGKIIAEMQYNYKPGTRRNNLHNRMDYNLDFKNSCFSGKVEYKTALLRQDAPGSVDLGMGFNFNNDFNETDSHGFLDEYNIGERTDPKYNTYFLQPYMFLESRFGPVRIKMSGEFQHFCYYVKEREAEQRVRSNDLTCKLITEWHFAPQKHLRLILDRKLQRPSNEQLFPFVILNSDSWGLARGNAHLTPELSHEIKLDYVSDYRWGDHSLMIELGGSYNYITDMVNATTETFTAADGENVKGRSYTTYENSGKNNVLSGNLLAMYSYKTFTLSMTGNVYHKHLENYGVSDHFTYYNLSLYPQFRMKGGWHGGAKLTYYSKVHRNGGTLSDCATASLTIGRRLGNLFVYAFDRVTLHEKSEDVIHADDGSKTVHLYNMSPNTAGFGVTYTF